MPFLTEIPTNAYDVVIIGAGSAGVMAAITCAKLGKSVLLIEKSNSLGGLAKSAEVGTICGLYRFSKTEGFDLNVGKSTADFVTKLQERCKTIPQMDATGLKYLPYSPAELNIYCKELLDETNISCLLGVEVVSVQSCDNIITEIVVEKEKTQTQIEVQAVIDASGVSCISQLLSLPMIESQFDQSASQVFTLENIDFPSETNLSLVLLTALRKGIINKELSEQQDRVYLVPGSMKEGRVSLKITIPLSVKSSTSDVLRGKAEKSIQSIVDYLRQNNEGFRNVIIHSLAEEVGVRVVQRAKGKAILNGTEVLSGVKSKTGIARGNWPMEIWSQAKRVELKFFEENDYYTIPGKCLMSDKMSNLFYAGRNISATDEGIASARVIGTCLQTGVAAGYFAAAYKEKEKLNVEEVSAQVCVDEFD